MMILTTFLGGIYRIIKYVHLIQVSKYCEKISFGFSVTFEIHVLAVRFGKYSRERERERFLFLHPHVKWASKRGDVTDVGTNKTLDQGASTPSVV